MQYSTRSGTQAALQPHTASSAGALKVWQPNLHGAGNLVQNATGNFTCYAADAYESGALHRVLVGLGREGPLPPDTTIFYRVGDPELGMSRELNFTTQPVMGPQALPYRCGPGPCQAGM